jgi:hypothetical protein
MGDAFLVEFANALEAARCAYDMQRTVKEFNVALSTAHYLIRKISNWQPGYESEPSSLRALFSN